MSWVDIENAMQQAVVEASGLASNRVYWSYQNYSAETGDHIVITFQGDIMVGQDWVTSKTDLTRPNGQEILRQVNGTREVPFQIECFTTDTIDNGSARRTAEITRTKFRLDSVRSRIRRANVSPFDSSPVSYIPDVVNAKFRGRAVVTIRCYVPVIDCFEYVGYIARVRVTAFPSPWTGGGGASSFTIDSLGLTASTYTVYYGSAAAGTYDAAFITALGSVSKASRVGSYPQSAGTTLYGFWAAPSAFGAATADFKDAATGFEASMTKVGTEVSVNGVLYDLWKTDTAGLGDWTLQVT